MKGIGPYKHGRKCSKKPIEAGGQSRPPLHSKSTCGAKSQKRADEGIGPYKNIRSIR